MIDEMYATGTKYLRDNYSTAKQPLYKQRPYIVGDLYVAPEWYDLPSTQRDFGLVLSGSKKFYEGLIRLAVGDRVLNWKTQDAFTAVSFRWHQSCLQGARGGLNMSQSMLCAATVHRMFMNLQEGNQLEGEPQLEEEPPRNKRRLM